MEEIQPFWRVVVGFLGWALTGSLLAVICTVLGLFGVQVPIWIAWTFVVSGIIIALYLAGRHTHGERVRLAERLRPRLTIGSGTTKVGGRHRIRVRNLSGVVIRFGARLESINENIGYQVPARLQITGTEHPYREGDVPPGPEGAYVDVLLEENRVPGPSGPITVPPESTLVGILSAETPPTVIWINKRHYEIVISAFPLSPDGGVPVRRKFYIIPQRDGTVILSDAGGVMG